MASTMASWVSLLPACQVWEVRHKRVLFSLFQLQLIDKEPLSFHTICLPIASVIPKHELFAGHILANTSSEGEGCFPGLPSRPSKVWPNLLPSLILHSALCILYSSQIGPHAVASKPQVSTAWLVSAWLLYTLQDSEVQLRAMKTRKDPLGGHRGSALRVQGDGAGQKGDVRRPRGGSREFQYPMSTFPNRLK